MSAKHLKTDDKFDDGENLLSQRAIPSSYALSSAAAVSHTSGIAAAVTSSAATSSAVVPPPIGDGPVALSLSDASMIAMSAMKTGALAKLDTQLAALYYEHSAQASAMTAFTSGVQQFASAFATSNDTQYVLVDTTAKDGDGASLLTHLQAIGLKGGSSFGAVASGWLPVASVSQLTTTADLGFARESAMHTNTGSVTTQADHAEAADTARADYHVTGAGLRVGILSDSFNSLNLSGTSDTTATDIASNDLPTDTHILADDTGGEDEGRAMAQLVHDLAPGSSIDFATADSGQAGFANNILALAAAGDKVIVDDVSYFAELSYQNGIISQAVNEVAAHGVSYFSSAGNDGSQGYESAWLTDGTTTTIGGVDYQLMEFAPGQNFLNVTDPEGAFFILQWDSPAASAGGPGSQNDLDLFLVDADGNIVAYSASNNIGGDPVEVAYDGTTNEPLKLYVGLASGAAPGDIRIIASGNGSPVALETVASNTNSGTLTGHHAADGAIAVGAVSFSQTPAAGVTPPVQEDYSSSGVDHILFDDEGNRLAGADTNSVALSAVDGGNTTFFYSDSAQDPDSLPNFFGTSAAAPDAAAVAALMLQANPLLTPGDIRALVIDSATAMADGSLTSGAGLIQADKAVGFATSLTIANGDQATLYGTHLNDTITGTNAADTLFGNQGDDHLYGKAGNDIIHGGDGIDVISGGDGDDLIYGDNGNDIIGGGTGNDVISGGAGDDLIQGGTGNDVINGGTGSNTAVYTNATSAETIDLSAGVASGGDGVDSLFSIQNIIGTAFADTITGDATNNQFVGGAGSDELHGGAGDDTLDGGSGAETQYAVTVDRPDITKPATVSNGTPGTAVIVHTAAGGDFDLVANTNIASSQTIPHATVNATAAGGVNEYYAVTLGANDHAIFDIDNNNFDSVIYLYDASGNLVAQNDDSYGDPGSNPYASLIDYTTGGNGAQTYYLVVTEYGESGLTAGDAYTLNVSDAAAAVAKTGAVTSGHDVIDGGDGRDTATYVDATSAVVVDLTLQNQLQNTRGAGMDYLTSIENITGSNYNDILAGDHANNYLIGGLGNDNIVGGDGNDRLFGGVGNDLLNGQAGNDLITGGAGRDTLAGGGGHDFFIYTAASDSTVAAPDLIVDFQAGIDKIDLSALHTSAADTYKIVTNGGYTYVEVDLGGNGSIDTMIKVSGSNAVTTSDILWTAATSSAAISAAIPADPITAAAVPSKSTAAKVPISFDGLHHDTAPAYHLTGAMIHHSEMAHMSVL